MSYGIPMYGIPCAVCGRPASNVGVVDRERFIHHVAKRTRPCAVGNEAPAPRQEPAEAAP